MHEAGIKVRYVHSDVETLERIEIIRDLRVGVFDVLVGINLLREGLDIPECALVAILDADKAGYLRSRTSLIQTIGRAARHAEGRGDPLCRRGDRSAERSAGGNPAPARESRWPITRRMASRPNPSARISAIFLTACLSAIMSPCARVMTRSCIFWARISTIMWRIWKSACRPAAADLEFEEAARLRDEIHRVRGAELEIGPSRAGRAGAVAGRGGPGHRPRPAAGNGAAREAWTARRGGGPEARISRFRGVILHPLPAKRADRFLRHVIRHAAGRHHGFGQPQTCLEGFGHAVPSRRPPSAAGCGNGRARG